MAESFEGDALGAIDGLSAQMKQLDGVTAQFGRTLSRAFSSGIAHGKGLDDILRNIGQRMIELALRSAFKPIESGIGGLLSGLVKGVTGAVSGGMGGMPGSGSVTPFAEGGVISTPHYFPLGKGLGVAGERGSEAILPLSRGPDGRLGVASRGGGNAVTVHMTVSTPDADSFRRSEAQMGALLARAVARGQRNL